MNCVQLVGNVGSDPKFSVVGENETPICELSIATTEYVNRQNRVEWHTVKMFGKKAEAARDYLAKGAKVAICGKLQTRSWVGKDGKKSYRTDIVGERMEFLSPSGKGENNASKVRAQINETIPDVSNIESMDGDDLPF